MRVPVRIVASEPLLSGMETGVFDQAANVACLPGILDYSWCMPDGHWGYGFPIGGVAGMDPDTGVISPGGIGFDINCGMRLCLTTLTEEEVRPRIHALVDLLFTRIPTGVGCTGFVRCSRGEFRSVAEQGSRWRLRNGFALPEDLEMTEEGGCFEGADASACSDKAIERGFDLIGTLGGGNHYCEIQVARPKNVYDQTTAQAFGITIPNQVVVMLHCGSRGFGHQVATDYLQSFLRVARDLCPHRLLGRRGRGGGFCLQRHRQRGCRHSRGRTEQKGREAGADRQHQGVTMPYRFREDIATADVAFEAWGGVRRRNCSLPAPAACRGGADREAGGYLSPGGDRQGGGDRGGPASSVGRCQSGHAAPFAGRIRGFCLEGCCGAGCCSNAEYRSNVLVAGAGSPR